MDDQDYGVYVQECHALAILLAGDVRDAEVRVGRLSEGQIERLAEAAAELTQMAKAKLDGLFDVRPMLDPENGLADSLESEGF